MRMRLQRATIFIVPMLPKHYYKATSKETSHFFQQSMVRELRWNTFYVAFSSSNNHQTERNHFRSILVLLFKWHPNSRSNACAPSADEGEYASYCARIHDEEIYHDLCVVKSAAREPRLPLHPPAFNSVCWFCFFFYLCLLIFLAWIEKLIV